MLKMHCLKFMNKNDIEKEIQKLNTDETVELLPKSLEWGSDSYTSF